MKLYTLKKNFFNKNNYTHKNIFVITKINFPVWAHKLPPLYQGI